MNVIELYEFKIGTTRSFFTSAAQDVLHGGKGDRYVAVPLSRSSIQSSATDFVSTLQIEMERNNPVAIAAQRGKVEVEVSRLVAGVKSAIWQGVVVGVSWNDAGAVLSCEDNLSPIKKLTPTKRYTRNCRHILYSPQCGVDIAAVSKPMLILESNPTDRYVVFTGISGLAHEAGYYGGGVLFNGTERHQITTTHTYFDAADSLTKVKANLANRATIPLGAGYSVSPGCNHTRDHCSGKFQNILNFGGFSYINFDQSRGVD